MIPEKGRRWWLATSAVFVLVGVSGELFFDFTNFESPGSVPSFFFATFAMLELLGWGGVVSGLASGRKRWTRLRVLKGGLLVLSLTLLGLGAADLFTVWTAGFNPAVQMEVSNTVVIEGVDFRSLVTELTFGTLAGALSLLVDMIEKGLIT